MNKKENVRLSEIKNIIAMIILTIIIGIITLIIYASKEKVQYISYNENSNVDYKVYLKDNGIYINTKYCTNYLRMRFKH